MHALLLASLPLLASGAATIAADDARFVTPLGRTQPLPGGGLALSWLGGGLRVAHTGTVLRATASSASAFGATSNFKLALYEDEGQSVWQGASWVPATGLNESVVVGVGATATRVLLNDPADYWCRGSSAAAAIVSLTTDGDFVPAAAAPARVLHVLGDSITAATNIHGGFKCADEGLFADYSVSWAGILCNAFGASCSTVAVGGKGLVRNCCDSGTTVPQFYTQARKNEADNSFAFTDARPDGVIVYLGTNDYSAGASPALDAAFAGAFLDLMANVTTKYYGTPAAPANITFFAVLGPMSPTKPANATLDAVARGTAAGYRVVLVNATEACGANLTGCTDGCASHPGVASHRNIARIVAPAVGAVLGWPLDDVL